MSSLKDISISKSLEDGQSDIGIGQQLDDFQSGQDSLLSVSKKKLGEV